MTPLAKQELHDFCERARKRRAREKEPRYPMTFADKTDAAVVAVCVIAAIVCLAFGL